MFVLPFTSLGGGDGAPSLTARSLPLVSLCQAGLTPGAVNPTHKETQGTEADLVSGCADPLLGLVAAAAA